MSLFNHSPLIILAWLVVFIIASLVAAVWVKLRVADAIVIYKRARNGLSYRLLIRKLSRTAAISRDAARALCERDGAPEFLAQIESRLADLRSQQAASTATCSIRDPKR